ncbi:MAG TPA: hypothetical protein VL986_00730 [Terracidiphilus sp.]|nr:hypothetical protein [Terracidiphilus sp.]
MASNSQLKTSNESSNSANSRGGLLKLGAIAVGSALLGGMAAAWWYRKTVQKLHESGENNNNPQFGIEEEHPSDETP